ncbi:MAG: radical SAM protein [Desulfurococcaceae archaeon]
MDTQSLLELKRKLREEVGSKLSESEKASALRDYHAKRPPRPCGLTVHTAIGCVYRCKYCYIYDMGFEPVMEPYPLTGLQLLYALLSNKYFIPGLRGTYLAFGSISEPFHPIAKNKTFEYIEHVYKYLGNPVQFSTKLYINQADAEKLYNLSKGRISPLVTIVTVVATEQLEPYSPDPEKRFETIRNLREAGLKPFLFLRPIIPGLTEKEYTRLIDLAVEYKAVGVVAGSLRVTKRILESLKEAGINVNEITRRMKVPIDKMKPGIQYDVETSDIKTMIAAYAKKKGLLFFPSACMANLYTHGVVCWRMTYYGLKGENLEKPSPREVRRILEQMGAKVHRVVFNKWLITIDADCANCEPRFAEELLRSMFMACVKIRTRRR